MAVSVGQSLGRYTIIEPLGEGGMATVYKAFDTRLERTVAIKFIRRDAFSPEILGQVLKRFDREAKILASLTHPNIVNVIDYGEFEESPYLVMPFLPGGTLKKYLGVPMPYQDAVRWLKPIADALAFAHQKGIIHRDIKPGNILITETGQPMLADFGIARLLETQVGGTLTPTGVGLGTPEYMAPEQCQAVEVDNRADIYSLGIVFYEMITGRKPYIADTPMGVIIKQITEPLPRPSNIVPSIPEQVENVLFTALAKKSNNRYQKMEEFSSALEKLVLSPEMLIQPRQNKPLQKIENKINRRSISDQMTQAAQVESAQTIKTAKNVKPSPIFSTKLLRIVGIIIFLIVIFIGGGYFLIRSVRNIPKMQIAAPVTQAAPTVAPFQTNHNPAIAALHKKMDQLPLASSTLIENYDFEDNQMPQFYNQTGMWAVGNDGSGNLTLQVANADAKNKSYITFTPGLKDEIIEFAFRLDKFNADNYNSGILDVSFRESYYGGAAFLLYFSPSSQQIQLVNNISEKWVPINQAAMIADQDWHLIRLVAQKESMNVYLDGNLLMTGTDSNIKSGENTLEVGAETSAEFDDLRIWSIP
jgi:serine/threonine protein kinase